MLSTLHSRRTLLHADLLFRLPDAAAPRVVMLRFPHWLAGAVRGE